jgi:hypothetical protein
MRRDNWVRDAGVAGSNPATPTIISSTYTFDAFCAQRNAQRIGLPACMCAADLGQFLFSGPGGEIGSQSNN